jgi:hypothetical protein
MGGATLWWVVAHSGPLRGQVIVHVSMSRVHVLVDDESHWVKRAWGAPIVCELRPGRHRVPMVQYGRVLYEEGFTLAAGQYLTHSASDGFDDGRSPGQPTPRTGRPTEGMTSWGSRLP